MDIIEIFKDYKKIKDYSKIINKESYDLLVTNTTINHNYLLAYLTFLESDDFIFYVTSNLYKATLAYENLCEIAGYENVNFYVTEEIVSAELLAVSHEFKFERIHAVNSLINNDKKIIVTHINAITRLLMPRQTIEEAIINLKVGDDVNREAMINSLVASGYQRTSLTTEIGDFSVRGEIIDIFPLNYDKPIRIDFFDTEIEHIKIFDPESQASIKDVDSVSIYPINELIYDNPEVVVEKIAKDAGPGDLAQNIASDIRNYNNLERLQKYIYYFTSNPEVLLDYVDEKIVLFEEVKQIKENYDKTIYELNEYLQTKNYHENLNLRYFEEFYDILNNGNRKVYLNEFKSSLNKIFISEILDLDGYSIIDYNNNVKNFIADIKANKQKTYIIAIESEKSYSLLREILEDNNINASYCNTKEDIKPQETNLIIFKNPFSFGFIESIEVISEANIFKKMLAKRTKYRSAYQNTVPIYSKDDISPGDYIVHYDYGIGKYLGIKTVELQDVKNDYIMLKFKNMELYIPIENINLLEKYQGTEGSVPLLSSIGTNEWEKKKQRVKKKLESIARELIEIQAIRDKKQGYVYAKDDYIQKQFESDFEYMETPDQIKTTNEIKHDMEKGVIVDRLVCGDVGYGKTEVAMRIAMKTVVNGKQVAYLAPTTILSRQHYYTFVERFEKYGIKIGLLNRLVPPKKQKEIINGLKTGDIDIVIGTHRLLNDEIGYYDLGLLIVDEEQRFGVTHKEKIKKYKNNVNVITLTATPIPRTLQMSIMGIRQLSLIETPPQNRYPIQTYVLELNDAVIREAIYREIGRSGQVFYLHNRISDLDKVYRKLKKLVPDARILKAHGQMDKNELEDAIQSFIDYEYDVLLCTTIIETGIDIPNTNTLIVDMADRLGLAQMYQIRGRVGRTNRVSYAYFMYDEGKVLTEAGEKRLNAIKEFTTLGSGYKLAVRDLAIRGSGDILGEEQSGFIDSIGLDMYMKMLDEAINEIKGVPAKEKVKRKPFNVEVSKHVSDQYVSDEDIKIYIHKKISDIDTAEKKEKAIIELTDRFGKITKEIKGYIDKMYLESLLSKFGVDDVKENKKKVEIIISEKTSDNIDGAELFKKAYQESDAITFEYKHRRIHMYIDKIENSKAWIKNVINLMESFVYN